MKTIKTKLKLSALVAMAAVAGVVAAPSAFAGASIPSFTLALPGTGGTIFDNNIYQLGYNGASYVTNTATSTPGIYSSVDKFLFNITTYNGGPVLNLGGGQLTGVMNATDISNLNTGSFIFVGGTMSLYYNSTPTYGTTSANNYGASSGTQLATFGIAQTNDPITSGGVSLGLNGSPTSNSIVTVTTNQNPTIFPISTTPTTTSPFLVNGSTTTPLFTNLLIGFATGNASATNVVLDPNLVTALGGTGTSTPPSQIYISNAGQIKLQYAPEPGSVALLGIGLIGLGMAARRRYMA